MKLAFIISIEERGKRVYEMNGINEMLAIFTCDRREQANKEKQTQNNIKIKPKQQQQSGKKQIL